MLAAAASLGRPTSRSQMRKRCMPPHHSRMPLAPLVDSTHSVALLRPRWNTRPCACSRSVETAEAQTVTASLIQAPYIHAGGQGIFTSIRDRSSPKRGASCFLRLPKRLFDEARDHFKAKNQTEGAPRVIRSGPGAGRRPLYGKIFLRRGISGLSLPVSWTSPDRLLRLQRWRLPGRFPSPR